MEMFEQGTRVVQAKASGGAEFMVWDASLEGLRACAPSMVHGAKVELLGRGFLIELPGGRRVNGRLFSSWMVPLADPEHTPISVYAPEHTPISVDAPSGVRFATDHNKASEHTPISVDARPTRTRGRAAKSNNNSRPQDHNTNNSDVHTQQASSDHDGEEETRSRPQATRSTEPGSRYAIALAGLRACGYWNPEAELANSGTEAVLHALKLWVDTEEDCVRRNVPRVKRPGGLIRTFLAESAGVALPPVADLGFARWWDVSAMPANVRALTPRPSPKLGRGDYR